MNQSDSPSTVSPPPPPSGLGVRGRKFWRETVEKYDLSAPELQVLREVCRTMDDLDALASAIAADGATVLGSKGQAVVNPCLTEARGQRLALHRLIAALALPDEDGASMPTAGSIRAKRAAAARWRGHRTDTQKRAALKASS